MGQLTFVIGLAVAVAAATAHSQGLRECRNAEDFVEALYDQGVTSLKILQDITTSEVDWPSAPVVLLRSVNVSGTEDDDLKWPVLDLGFVTAKVKIAANVTFSFTSVVLRNWRRGPLFQAPGIDLIATNDEIANRTWDASVPNLVFREMGWIQRACFDAQLAYQVTGRMDRPKFAPGTQNLTSGLPQPGCSDSTSAPVMRRCWPMAFEYIDVITDGYNLQDFTVEPAGYVLWLLNTPVRCESVLDADCIERYDVIGCFYKKYPNVFSPPPPPPGSTPSPPLGGSGGGDYAAGDGHSQRLAAILGGVLGGVALVAVLGGLATWLVLGRVRRERQQCHHDLLATDGGASSGPTIGVGSTPLPASVVSLSKSASSDGAELLRPGSSRRSAKGVTSAGFCEPELALASPTALDKKPVMAMMTASPTGAAPQQHSFISAIKDASSAAPVTPQTPLKPDVNLALRLDSGGGELELLPGVIGKGTFGRVVSGRYGGQPVAVKLLDYGLLQAGRAGGAGRAGRAGGQAAVAAAAVAGAAAAPETSTAIRCLSLSMGSAAAAAAAVTAPASGTAAVAAADSAPAADIAAVVVTAEAAASVDVGTLPSFDIRSLAERCARVPEYLLRLAHPAGVDSTFSGIRVDGSGGGVSGHGPAAVASAVTVPTAAEVKAAVTEAEAAAHVAGDAVSERTAPDVLFFRMQAHGFGAAKPTGLREFMERHCGGGVAGDNGGGGGGGGILLGGDLLLNEVDSGQDSGSEGVSLEGPWVKGAEAAGAPTVKAVPDADAKAAVAAAAVARDGSRPRDIRQRTLIQEMEVLARVRHPNIVRLLAACTQPPHMCLVMELMETSLDRLLYGSGPVAPLMPLDKVLHIALQMASALEYLHPTIMHRDLKPANVLLQNAASPTPVVKLADFGLSRLQTSVLVTANVGVGTIAYMAPETLTTCNCVITHHVDIYALGIILWELLAGLRPWAGLEIVQIAVAVEMRRQRPPLDVLPAQRCPRKLRTLIQRCWEHVPERRPAAAEVVKELLQVQMQLQNENRTRPMSLVSLTSQQAAEGLLGPASADLDGQ